MNSRLCCCLNKFLPRVPWAWGLTIALVLGAPSYGFAGNAPDWMRSLANAPLPAHDEKTDAVRLYAEKFLTVDSGGKIKTIEREAYKILRPDGEGYGTVRAPFDSETRITDIKGWCIPAQGKDYEVKEGDSMETALADVDGSELISDLHTKLLRIPAAEPGNIVGYEIEHEDRPYVLDDEWQFQISVPTGEAHFTLQLPPGWGYKAIWINHPEVAPTGGGNRWTWTVNNVPEVKPEEDMPPWQAVAGEMVVSLIPPGGQTNRGFGSWDEMGRWYLDLANGRRDSSPEIKQKVAELTTSATTPLAKMQALAGFVQSNIRYVAIELGIGGYQPHAASSVFSNRYGDCKDKVTLLSSMLQEIGVTSYYLVINTERGALNAASPPRRAFNHMILAIQLPDGPHDPSLTALMRHPQLGDLLFFDPTDPVTPFGRLSGNLQASYGLLVTPRRGELVQLPQLPATENQINRTAKLSLDPGGTLQGDVQEIRVGDPAGRQRWMLRTASTASDRVKPIETILAHSLATFQITKATVANLAHNDSPFEYDYSFVSSGYAKSAGNMLLVRPRVLGSKTRGILETKEPRLYPVEFDGPERDTDVFEITLPQGYDVEDLPPPVDADYSFAAYHSKSEKTGNTLRYTRTFEVKELSVPLSKMEELKKFYRTIAGDERSAAVLTTEKH